MHDSGHAEGPQCPSCGCYLASDDHLPVCSPCRRRYRHARRDGYRPQHDASLRARVLAALQAHRGQRINVYRTLGMWPCGLEEWIAVKGHVRYLRRHGHAVLGYHDGTYLYVGGRTVGSRSCPTPPSH